MEDIIAYQVLLDLKQKEIDLLKFKVENYESIQRGLCCECERAIQDLSDIQFKIMPFEDDYFKGLSYKQIAELAKKSIRITAINSELENRLEKLKELYFISESKSEELDFSAFKQWFDEVFSYEIYKLIKEEK